MPRSPVLHRARAGALVAAVCLTLLPGTTGTAGAAPQPRPAAPPTPRLAAADDLLAAPTRGVTALRSLGDDLAVAARRNDLAPAALERLLQTDPTAWLTTEGRLLYIDPAPARRDTARPDTARTDTVHPAAAPLKNTFALHSNPGAPLSIFLDVDGATVSGTQWNTQFGVVTSHPAWDPRHNGPAFNGPERRAVQKVWAMVAEDFAAFDVDVTTEDPGPDGLTRTDSTDTTYGTRVLITPGAQAWNSICSRQCGGVAFLDVYDSVGTAHQPAWVFAGALSNDVKNIVEAASHEIGHNLALAHDGNARVGYDTGHGSWAPIMGVGYDRPITQWSKGDYPGATNHQDDLAVIGDFLPRRADEAGDTRAAAVALPRRRAVSYITTREDVDTYRLGSCGRGATVSVTPAATSPDLDVRARVVDAGGAVLASANPPSATIDRERARNMGTTLRLPARADGSVLLVDGVGRGTWATGYDDYASIGAYTVKVTGCTADGATLPGAHTA